MSPAALPRRGRIAILDDTLPAPQWLGNKVATAQFSFFQGGFYGTTQVSDALVVTVVEENRNPQELLLRLDNGNHLAIRLTAKGVANIEHSPDHFALILPADLDGNSPYPVSPNWQGETKAAGWTISDNGTLGFSWPLQGGYHQLTASVDTVLDFAKGTAFVEYIAAPAEYIAKYSNAGWRTCRLAFEQL